MALLLTGIPGVGKTTVLRRVAAALGDRPVRGFLTEEIRFAGRRVGFRIESFAGDVATLAHVDVHSVHGVGRYRVDVETLDRVVAAALVLDDCTEVYLIDEIGKMECLSQKFVLAMRLLLDSGRPLVATVARRGVGFIAEVKARPDATLWEVTRENRHGLPERILSHLERKGSSET